MSVFKKSLSLFVALCIVLSSAPITSYAETSSSISADAKKSPFAAKDTSFCSDKAPEMMKSLNDANSKNIKRLEELRQEVVGVTSEMEILNTMGAFKDQYVEGLRAIKPSLFTSGATQREDEKLKNLGNMKKVVRYGLMLNVVGLLFKNGKLDKDEALRIGTICKK